MVTEPSAFWKFSSTATRVRPTASPDPLSVWTSSFLPCAFLNRVCMRRAWKASQFETELISRYMFCAGTQTSRSKVLLAPLPMSPVESRTTRYGSSSFCRIASAWPTISSCAAALGMRDLHHLDLVELVLADHAARVAPGAARLGAKARRVRRELDRQGR